MLKCVKIIAIVDIVPFKKAALVVFKVKTNDDKIANGEMLFQKWFVEELINFFNSGKSKSDFVCKYFKIIDRGLQYDRFGTADFFIPISKLRKYFIIQKLRGEE